MDGLSSVARPTGNHTIGGMVQPSGILLGVRTPPEAWNMRGQVRSPQPQAALEGGLTPLLAPRFPALASLPRPQAGSATVVSGVCLTLQTSWG